MTSESNEQPINSSQQPEEECPWCKYMKGGPCRAVFEVWQACIDSTMVDTSAASRKAAIDTCADVTAPLFECMVKHPDYYGPQMAGMPGDKQAAESSSTSTAAGGSPQSGNSPPQQQPALAAAATRREQQPASLADAAPAASTAAAATAGIS